MTPASTPVNYDCQQPDVGRKHLHRKLPKRDSITVAALNTLNLTGKVEEIVALIEQRHLKVLGMSGTKGKRKG